MTSPPATPASGQTQALQRWKDARETAFAAFQRQRRIGLLWERLTAATDTLLRALAGEGEPGFALAAVGGYGRGQLFPYSDIDLLILVPEGGAEDPRIGPLLYALWDLPVKIGHAVRSVSQCLEEGARDHTVRTALLDLRHVAGDAALTQHLAEALHRQAAGESPLAFVEAKLKEREARLSKSLDSRYVLEPNLKEGKGALRDLQMIGWLARYCYGVPDIHALAGRGIFTPEDAKTYDEALKFFSTVRASLHLLSGRADERLTFDAQLALAEAYHYRLSGEEAAKRFMKHYFHHVHKVGALTRSFCTFLEEEHKRAPQLGDAQRIAREAQVAPFHMQGGRLGLAVPGQLQADPLAALDLFATAQREELDIHPEALRAVDEALALITRKQRETPRAAAAFLSIVLSPKAPDAALRKLIESGLMAKILPEFSGITGQMQYDRYHTYTVDEHTLVAIAHLRALERGEFRETMPIATTLIAQTQSRTALYLAMLLHDIGKGAGAQAERGEALSRVICRRLGCSEADTAMVVWLVGHHLLMSDVAFRRDLDDPRTIADFAARVQMPERLRLLLLVTVADIIAVGPKVWNGWKGALLRTLYKRTMEILTGGASDVRIDVAHAQALLAGALKERLPALSPEQVGQFVQFTAPGEFWHRPAHEQATLAMLYFVQRESGDIALQVDEHGFHDVTTLTLCAEGGPALLAQVAGTAALMGANIVSAKLMAASDGVRWISIGLQDATGNAFPPARIAEGFRPRFAAATDAAVLARAIARAQPRYFTKGTGRAEPAQVHMDNSLSTHYTVIEVGGADRIGFLYAVAATLAQHQVSIVTAHIGTYGKRAVDVFYVKDAYGHKIEHPLKRAELEQALLAAIAPVS